MTPTTKYRQIYNSVSDLMAACKKSVDAGRCGWNSSSSFVGRKFSSWAEIEKAIIEPWQEGLDVVQGMIYEVDRELSKLAPPKDIKRRKKWGDDGDELDLDRMRSGQDPWLGTSRQIANASKSLTLFVNMSVAGMYASEVILWRGAATVCLSDLFEKAGYRVEVWTCDYSSNTCGDQLLDFKGALQKAIEDPLDIATLTNSVSGWFLRTVYFQADLIIAPKNISFGHGCPRKLTPQIDCIQELSGKTTPVIIDGVFSRSAALDLIKKIILEIEKPVELVA